MLADDRRITWRTSVAAPPSGAADGIPAGAARLSIDATRATEVHVVAAADGAREDRTVEIASLDAVATEIVAQIAREAAWALLGEGADALPAAPGIAVVPPPILLGPLPVAPPTAFPQGVVAVAAPAAETPAPWSLKLSAGYLMRNIFDSSPAGSAPLAQGVAAGAALFIDGDPISVGWSLSLEYHRATADAQPIGAAAGGVGSHYSGVATYGLFGIAMRPGRFVEAGAGFGLGMARNSFNLGLGGGDTAAWRAGARGQVSIAAIGLPAGLDVTAALTLDRLFGSAYDDGERPLIASNWIFPSTTSLQLGALVMVGWRP
jgi:hypothetical protein